ncbi:MAG: GWxTD domain-containing protein [Candidatus Eisenbacteria bacterium]|nr:GWxTD domain-containing protein [Candidatus Eisenbacteria bacterium]
MAFRSVRAGNPRILLIAALVLGGQLLPHAAAPSDLAPLRSGSPPFFTCDIAISIDSEARPALSASISLPYPNLEWIRVPNGYAAGVAISVAFEPRHKGRIYGDAWQRRLSVADFATTTTHTAALVERRTINVPPGSYRVRVSVRDLNGELESQAFDDIEVPDYSRIPVGFADLELGLADSTTGSFTPIPTRLFGLNTSLLAARVTLFDRRPGAWPRSFSFHYRIVDDLGEQISVGTQPFTLDHSAQPVVLRPSSAGLFLGSYVFEIQLVEGKSRWRAERSFMVEQSGPPRGKDFERMLEPLSYIGTQQEIAHLRSLPAEKQAEGWDEFWSRRDPSPDSPPNEAQIEFFRRVRYAEQHFQGFGPGWRSDMGRIYIKFGAPSQIEMRPPTSRTGQLEIWHYNQPARQFVFEDREGFGRFVLQTPGGE